MSLKKIAEIAGTSVSTVSRVLNHPEHKCNNPELQQKIWKAAEQLQYTTNLGARNLRMGITNDRSPFFVDIYLTRFHSMDNDAFFMELYQIIQEELLANECILGETLNSLDIMNLSKEIDRKNHVPYKTDHILLRENSQNFFPIISTKKDTGLIILGKCPEKVLPILKKDTPTLSVLTAILQSIFMMKFFVMVPPPQKKP